MKITRFGLLFNVGEFVSYWNTQGETKSDDSFAYAVLYATEAHAEKAAKRFFTKYPGAKKTHTYKIVPVTTEFNL